jgi:predicted ester cyclase
MNRASRLFAGGQTRNIALADDIFSESTGVVVGVAGPKRRLPERLAGFPELSLHIADMFSAGDKIVTRLDWRGLVPVHIGVEAADRPVTAAGFAAGAPRAAK